MALVTGLLAATKIAGSIAGSILGGAKKSGVRKRRSTISKEPIWSSGTTRGGEYLSSGERKAVFRQSTAKISSSSSIVPTGAIVTSPGGAITSEGLGMTMGKTLEERVANNEKKITMLKRILNTHIRNPVVGNELEETNRILEDIGNALALDFSNRITQEKTDIANLRASAESKKRGGIESGIESANKVSSKLGKAFDTIVGPIKGVLDKIIGFFSAIAAGWLADRALTWLSKNSDKVTAFFKFLADHGKKLLIGLGVLIGGVIAVKLVKTLITVTRWVRGALKIMINAYRIARLLLKFGPRALGKISKAGTIGKGSKKIGEGVARKVANKGGFKVLGALPLIGNVIDIGMAGYRASQGDWTGAGLSLGSAIPGPVGWGFAATDIGRDVVGGGATKGKIGSVADTYNDLVGTSTGMDFSSNIVPSNLEPPSMSDVTVMDPVKLNQMMGQSGGTSGVSGEVQSSIPLVGASDNSNSYINNTKDLLGIYE